MFEFDEDSQRYNAVHHPFTAPKDGHEDWMVTAPEKCISKGYDMVLNGWEMGGWLGAYPPCRCAAKSV